MKQLKFGVVVLGLCLVAGCNSGKKAEATSEHKEAVSKDEKQPADGEKDKAADEMDHDALLKEASNLEGKEVTVKAISWGTSATIDGTKRLGLGPKKLEGLRQAQLVADFEKDDTSVDAVSKDAEVKLKCTVGPMAHGARQLKGCKIL